MQLGFVAGTALSALLNLADVVPAPAAVRALGALPARSRTRRTHRAGLRGGARASLPDRLLPGRRLSAGDEDDRHLVPRRRGLAVGTIVGALTVGKATPYLVHAIPDVGIRPVMLAASARRSHRRDCSSRSDTATARTRSRATVLVGARRTSCGVRGGGSPQAAISVTCSSSMRPGPGFRHSSPQASLRANPSGDVAAIVPRWSRSATLAVGGAGCVWGGLVRRQARAGAARHDRARRERCLLPHRSASFSARTLWLLAPLALVWGFFVVADSAQFALSSPSQFPRHAVGTALTVQTSLGFLLTMVTIQGLPVVADAIGWQWSFALLALGPLAGIGSIRRLVGIKKQGA